MPRALTRVTGWLLIASAAVWPQAPTRPPEFDVASIRPGRPTAGDAILCENGRLTVYNYTLRTLMQIAWQVRDVQILGGPTWIDSETYYISAKGDPSATDIQCRIMLQNLLKDRFGLLEHNDLKDLPVYALVLTRGGPKFHESPLDVGPNIRMGKGNLAVQKVSMANVARVLSSTVDRPVLDKTGLAGKYTFSLEWDADNRAVEGAADDRLPKPPMTSNASLFDALEIKLGLRLEVQQGPVSVIVIDHIERPSTN